MSEPAAVDLPGDASIRRILLIKWSAMGDVVMASAAMEDIARAFPGRELHLNAMPPWDALFRADPRFARVFSVDMRGRERGPAGLLRWLREVRAGGYDLVIDLQCSDRSRILLGLLRLARRRPRLLGNRPGFPYDVHAPAMAGVVHPGERLRAALRAGGIAPRATRPVLHVPEASRARAAALRAAHGLEARRFAVFLPGSQAAGYLKRWGAERYARLARALRGRGVERVVLLGGPEEVEECARIRALGGEAVVDLCGQTAIPDLVPICEAARFVIANDTGTAHVAAAGGRPMVVLCGPTDPRRVKPLGEQVETLQIDLPCRNCYRKHCRHHACMRLLRPELVLERIPPASP